MKEVKDIWSLRLRAAKIPFIIIGVYYILSLVTGLLNFSLYESIFMNSLLGYVVLIGAFIVGAYIALVDYAIPKKRIVQGGLLAGAGIGLIGAIVSLILLKNTALMDVSVALLLEKAASMGTAVPLEMAETQIMLGTYISFVIGPVFNGGFGALFAWIGALIAAKFESTHQAKDKDKK